MPQKLITLYLTCKYYLKFNLSYKGPLPFLCVTLPKWKKVLTMFANFSILLQQETFLLDAMFEVPSQPDIAEVVIDEDVIKGKKGPQYIYARRKSKKHQLHRVTLKK